MWSDVRDPSILSASVLSSLKWEVMPAVRCRKWSLSLNVLPKATPRVLNHDLFPSVPHLHYWILLPGFHL